MSTQPKTAEKKVERTCEEEAVLLKYKAAALIANKVLKQTLAACVDGASIKQICETSEKLALDELAMRYKKEKDIKKGIAFPLSLCVNHCINHFSPLPLDEDCLLKTTDTVKIDFGVHIDGFIAVVAHTIVVGATAQNKVTGRQADVVLAAHYASEAALNFFRAGTENYDVTNAINKITDLYNVNPCEGMISFNLLQHKIDGDKLIHTNVATGTNKNADVCKFENYEVYGLDVVVSTGKGLGKELDLKTTIYKKQDINYNLKLKCSNEFFRKVKKDHGTMPFNLRYFDDIKKARMGVMECVSHGLVAPYPVLWEKPGEHVAQFKYTVVVMPSGPVKICGLPIDISQYKSDVKILQNEEIKALLDASKKCKK